MRTALAQPSFNPRELVIHTGLDPTLISCLSAETEANRRHLRGRGISLQPASALVPAILRNDWRSWQRRERQRLWKPWRRGESVWVMAPSVIKSLLQERRFTRIRQQVESMDFRLVIVVHLLDCREQLARDYARSLINLRWSGTVEDYAARQMARDPLRYRVDQLLEPLLTWCGARGFRVVHHNGSSDPLLPTTWSTLEALGGARPAAAPTAADLSGWLPVPRWWRSDLSQRRVLLSRWLLEALEQPPRGKDRQRLRTRVQTSLASAAHPETEVTSWASWLQLPHLPDRLAEAQRRLALKVWGSSWPEEEIGPSQPELPAAELQQLRALVDDLCQTAS